MNAKAAFLESTSRLILGFQEFAGYRLVGSTAVLAVLQTNVFEVAQHKDIQTEALQVLREVTPSSLDAFQTIFDEGYLVLSYAWLEAYLDDVEEVLYLTSPESLGDSIQIKLGKVLEVGSVNELLHDVVRKRIREHGQWSLRGRLDELREKRGFVFNPSTEDINWITDVRNRIVHERSYGKFELSGSKVTFTSANKRMKRDRAVTSRFSTIVRSIINDLYSGACRGLAVNPRNKRHRANLEIMKTIAGREPRKNHQSTVEQTAGTAS